MYEMQAALIATALLLLTIVICVAIWQYGAIQRAKTSKIQEEAYSKLAAQATAAIRSTVENSQKQNETLAEIGARLEAIEKLLKQVE